MKGCETDGLVFRRPSIVTNMKKRIPLTTLYIVVFCVILLTTTVVLGLVLMNRSQQAMMTLIRERMLDVSKTAAAMIDGDEFASFTSEDVGTEAFRRASSALKIFQDNIELEYIYAVRQVAEKEFVFIIDPDPLTPAKFGESTVYTEALDTAGRGTSAVDDSPFEDRWGRFYSSYSPIFDSNGAVAGVVGVDFNAEWYEKEIASHGSSILVISVCSLTAGGFVVLLITTKVRRRFGTLSKELTSLSGEVDSLSKVVFSNPRYEMAYKAEGTGENALEQEEEKEDSISVLSARIRSMRKELRRYIAYLHDQAYIDSMTGVSNKTAYLDEVHAINEKIKDGTVAFTIAVFDVNGLKNINDNYGHEQGDQVITDAAAVMREVFEADHLYRIGGDEFIAVLEDVSEDEVGEMFGQLDERIADFNGNGRTYESVLSFSKGAATYRRGKDKEFKEVFKRADEAMYRDKGAYYRQFADRRKSKPETE